MAGQHPDAASIRSSALQIFQRKHAKLGGRLHVPYAVS
jgi:hypothetical protein